MQYQIDIAAENALILYFGEAKGSEVSEQITAQIHLAYQLISEHFSEALLDLVPSYASLLVMFDPMQLDHYQVRNRLREILAKAGRDSSVTAREIELPVYYGGEVALDLAEVANKAGLSCERVVELHQAQRYQVYAIGFAPGFGYLGEVDPRIATARLPSPRAAVPKGAVGIADRQTAIYPAQSPGGWNIIGRCPLAMFEPHRSPPMLFKVGDLVRFKSIDKTQYLELGGVL